MPPALPEIVARQIARWLPPDQREAEQRIVVAVSGGADSVALARAMALALPGDRLILAHFHHALRGADSDADAAFARQLASELGLLFATDRWDRSEAAASQTPGAAAPSEEAARDTRYAFLARTAREHGAGLIAAGHTADDQTETILHHLLRGTGLRGLRGIPASRPLSPGSDVRLIRPLLEVTRTEIEAWLRSLGQEWRLDRSNDSSDFTRNRLRHELLPHLRREFQPQLDSLLARLGRQADETLAFLQDEARALLAAMVLDRQPGEVRLSAPHVERRPCVLVREALVELWSDQGWPRQGMSQAHWQRAEEVLRGNTPAVDLPDGLRIERRGGLVVIRGPVSQAPPEAARPPSPG